MALDHTRDYFGNATLVLNVADPTLPGILLYLTRLITHFCAPTFIFLAGVSAFLTTKKMSRPKLARWLATRGLWLIFLELTVLLFAWQFNTKVDAIYLAVIWAIGCSMLALVPMIFLPLPCIGVIAAVLILGHNALDGVTPETFGALGWLWKILHVAFA